jgi:hypothetical protein
MGTELIRAKVQSLRTSVIIIFAGERRISMKGVSPWSKARLARRVWMAQAFSLKH